MKPTTKLHSHHEENTTKSLSSPSARKCSRLLLLLVALIAVLFLVTFRRFRQIESQLSSYSFEDTIKSNYLQSPTATKRKLETQPKHGGVRVIPLSDKQLIVNSSLHKVHFLNHTHVTRRDVFSASWLQRTSDFMDMNLTRITFCEAAVFAAFARRTEKLRMTLDYLDFSIEHLSKWWKMLYFQRNQAAYDSVISHLTTYIRNYNRFPTPVDGEPVFQHTLAMVAFMPYGRKEGDERGFHLTTVALAATLESLRRAQMGRVVVVGLLEGDTVFVREAFRFLADTVPLKHEFHYGRITKIGHMEVAFVQGSNEYGYTKFDPVNVPRATLFGVREALNISLLQTWGRSEAQTKYMQQWLGNTHEPDYWKYLYLTEPDSILQSRPNTLQQIKDEVDKGSIFAPHRLQPIPHESDLQGMSEKFHMYQLEERDGFENVLELDAHNTHDVCCDENAGKHFKPGLNNFVECGNGRWWACGFKKHSSKEDDPHVRLRPYQLMRLSQGTGLVTIAGTLHGRRCIAGKNSICEPPLDEAPLQLAEESWEEEDPVVLHDTVATQQTALQHPEEEVLKVKFLDRTQLALADTFSASWLQRMSNFVDMDLDNVTIPEHASFSAFFGRMTKLRMTADLLDFSVEHLSKWWKMLDFQNSDVVYNSITSKLEHYIQKGRTVKMPTEPVLKDTLAMIAFMPYGRITEEKSFNLTVLSLAATIESLRRSEMGRVVVFGLGENDGIYAKSAFRYLVNNLQTHNDSYMGVIENHRIGHLEAAFVKGEVTRTGTHYPNNVPVETLLACRKAFSFSKLDNSDQDTGEDQYRKAFLGVSHDSKHWKYLYLTEPDSILQTRATSLDQIKNEIENGAILAPHRLQPIPHESDLVGLDSPDTAYLRDNDFQEVVELNAHDDHDVCCDEQAGKHFKPGLVHFPKCGHKIRWWACGFQNSSEVKEGYGDPHIRLRPYQLMRLSQGTGLTTIAGTLHGRRCFPAKSSWCK